MRNISFAWRRRVSYPSTQFVRGSNNVHARRLCRSRARPRHLISTLDNLVKGSAGQAIQNFNLMFGLAGNHRGCEQVALFP